jgi:hypothetical protein
MGRAEVARAQITNMLSLVSVNSACSSHHRARDRRGRIAALTIALTRRVRHRRASGPSVITHNSAGETHGAHPERTQSLLYTVL